MCKCFRNEASVQWQRGSITSVCRRQRGWIPVERLQQNYCRTALPASPVASPFLCPGKGQNQADSHHQHIWVKHLVLLPWEWAPGWRLSPGPGCRSPVVNSNVMNLTLLALTLSESTKLHQSFRRCFIPLKKGCVKDAVGTRLIR